MSNWTFGSHHYIKSNWISSDSILKNSPQAKRHEPSLIFTFFTIFASLTFSNHHFSPISRKVLNLHPPLLIFIHSHPLSTILSNIIYFHPYPYHPTSSIFIKCQQFSSILFNVIHFHDFSSISSIILSATMSVSASVSVSVFVSLSNILCQSNNITPICPPC